MGKIILKIKYSFIKKDSQETGEKFIGIMEVIYINKVKDFLDGYDDSKEKIDFATKKQLAALLFKNIKIAPAIGGALPQKRISFSLFAPFNFLFSEAERKSQCQTNQKLTKIRPKKSTLEHSAVR